MRRFAFNRFQDGVKQREIYQLINEKFECNCHLKNSALRSANGLFTLNKDKKSLFWEILEIPERLDFKRRIKRFKKYRYYF